MQLSIFCSPIHRLIPRLLWGAVPFLLSVSLVSGVLALGPQPAVAQATNQSYDCGSYGAGSYSSNDCVAATSPTPLRSLTPTQNASIGRLPITGAQLSWIALIGVGLVCLGVALSLRRKRHEAGGRS